MVVSSKVGAVVVTDRVSLLLTVPVAVEVGTP
jgi:hypothetical protein